MAMQTARWAKSVVQALKGDRSQTYKVQHDGKTILGHTHMAVFVPDGVATTLAAHYDIAVSEGQLVDRSERMAPLVRQMWDAISAIEPAEAEELTLTDLAILDEKGKLGHRVLTGSGGTLFVQSIFVGPFTDRVAFRFSTAPYRGVSAILIHSTDEWCGMIMPFRFSQEHVAEFRGALQYRSVDGT